MNARITHYLHHSHIVLCELSGGWSWSAIYEVFARIDEFTAGSIVPYSIIFDARSMSGFSTRQFFGNARHLVTHLPRFFTGTMVVIGANDLLKTMVSAARQIHPRLYENTSVRYADSIEEAFELLCHASHH